MAFSLRFNVLKGHGIPPWQYRFVTPPGSLQPRSDARGYFVHSALGPDLMTNAKNAVRGVIQWLESVHNLSREDAYILCSEAADLRSARSWISRTGCFRVSSAKRVCKSVTVPAQS